MGEPHLAIPELLDRLSGLDQPLARLTTRQVSLEDVFVSLTGRHLRDNEDEGQGGGQAHPARGRRRGAGLSLALG